MTEDFKIRNGEVEQQLKDIGGLIHRIMPKGWGFTLLMFDTDKGDKGSMFYISDANREDMLKAMKEFIDKNAN